MPGKILPSTWRRRLRAPTSAVLADPDVRRRLAVLSGLRKVPVLSEQPIGEVDLHLFNEGTHRRLHRTLGAQPAEAGTWFAVWAPNAASVDVVGDFDGWAGQQAGAGRAVGGLVAARRRRGVGQSYRYGSRPHGERMDKSDPFGGGDQRAAVDGVDDRRLDHEWGDAGGWRARRTARDAPMSIYELHLGSWGRTHAGQALPEATTSSPPRSPSTCSPTASPTSSCCR